MKTTIDTVSKLLYVIDINNAKANCKIKISLDDDCKNGHADFSITADFWETGKPRAGKYETMAGCCHEEILKIRPDLKQFVDLHLADVDGVPMYAIANGFYHLKHSSADVARDYCRLTAEEFEQIKTSEDETIFQYWLERLGVVERWKREADNAIALLEKWTDQKFKDTSTEKPFKTLGSKMKEVEQAIAAGYYSPEAIAAREQAKVDAKREAIKQGLNKERAEAIAKIECEYTVKMAVHLFGLPLDNFIFYDHTHQGVFNWKDYEKKISQQQLDEFLQSEAYKIIPFAVEFKLQGKKV